MYLRGSVKRRPAAISRPSRPHITADTVMGRPKSTYTTPSLENERSKPPGCPAMAAFGSAQTAIAATSATSRRRTASRTLAHESRLDLVGVGGFILSLEGSAIGSGVSWLGVEAGRDELNTGNSGGKYAGSAQRWHHLAELGPCRLRLYVPPRVDNGTRSVKTWDWSGRKGSTH